VGAPSGIDRSDPAVRAAKAVARFERRHYGVRPAAAFALLGLGGVAPFAAAPLTGEPGATVGAIVAAVFLAGCGVAVWPWDWSDAEREHHTLAAIWAQNRADDGAATPWERYAAWARADEDRVELVLITRSGTAWAASRPSPYKLEVVARFEAEAVVEATAAMERLRGEAAEREARARERHAAAVAAAARKPYDDAIREVEEAAEAHQRRAEAQMRRELAEQEAAERRAQASAVARALRRP
jgi:hypothetical protein